MRGGPIRSKGVTLFRGTTYQKKAPLITNFFLVGNNPKHLQKKKDFLKALSGNRVSSYQVYYQILFETTSKYCPETCWSVTRNYEIAFGLIDPNLTKRENKLFLPKDIKTSISAYTSTDESQQAKS
ncbi:hypothetical protein LAZ67_7001343 [Cordylochernes scorpioides]|uniref:Uncharacterized protein n=1 Tax=Cordylochernes scorpioides TaxID=51811 RepID=A0ABY6KN61_9ARAC|nr:hypothetical protein LAZ67_7001343 [Cordylochernes scorpioides]